MHIASYRYFLAVAASGSIRQAAEELHVSASAISRQIQLLEHGFAAALFERRPSGMVLTEEGKILAAHMQRTMREMTLARAEMDALHGLLTGTVHFAASEGVMSLWLLPAIVRFREQHPGIAFAGSVMDAQAIYDAVAADKVDFGVAIFKAQPHPDIEVLDIFSKPFKVAMSPAHPLAGRDTLTLAEIAAHPLSLLGNSFYTHQVLKSALRRAGLVLRLALELNHIDMLKEYVALSCGITILPEDAVAREMVDGRLAIADIDHPDFPTTDTILCVRKERTLTAAAEAFVTRLRSLRRP